jgi:hypothetical protein
MVEERVPYAQAGHSESQRGPRRNWRSDMTGFLGAATAIVTARWNRRAVLSEEAIAALKQQMDLIKQQATQTETNLKEQAYYKELSPADIQKQLTAVAVQVLGYAMFCACKAAIRGGRVVKVSCLVVDTKTE